jgi:hypothetical protein
MERMTAATRQRLLDATAKTPSPTRRQASKQAAWRIALAIAWMIALFFIAGGMERRDGQPSALAVAVMSGLSALAIAITALVFARGSSPLGRSDAVLAGSALVVPSGVMGWLSLWQPAAAGAAPFGWRCLGLSVALGAALLIAFIVSKRGTDPVHPTWLGGAFGAVAGAWAAVLAAGWCPLFNIEHVWIGHVVPVVILSGAGLALGGALLRISAPRDRSLDL